jgi:hypothetical protein
MIIHFYPDFKDVIYMIKLRLMDDKNEKEWIDVTPRSKRRNSQCEIYEERTKLPFKFRSQPIKHFWNGFDVNGAEKWFLELENGNILSSKDKSYQFLVRKFFPNDTCRA